jgi:hypothetical protein
MGSACRTAPSPRKYPSLSALSTSIPLFGLEPFLRSCRRSQHLVVSTISLHVMSTPTSLHVDSIPSCHVDPNIFMSATSTHVESYLHIDLIPSHRPRTFMSTLIPLCRPQHLFLSTSTSISYCQPQSLVSASISFMSNTTSSISSMSAKYIIHVGQVHRQCRPSISSMSAKYTIDDVDLVHHAASTFDVQYEGILPVTSTFACGLLVCPPRSFLACLSFFLTALHMFIQLPVHSLSLPHGQGSIR